MTVENISWSISAKECCRPRRGLNPRPPVVQLDGASNWATETGRSRVDKSFLAVLKVSGSHSTQTPFVYPWMNGKLRQPREMIGSRISYAIGQDTVGYSFHRPIPARLWDTFNAKIQSTLVISISFFSNNRLSRSEKLVPVLAWKSNNRYQTNVEKFLLFFHNFSIWLQELNYINLCEIRLFDLFFLNSAILICRGTYISKYFREFIDFEITRVDCTV